MKVENIPCHILPLDQKNSELYDEILGEEEQEEARQPLSLVFGEIRWPKSFLKLS